jgi:carbamoyltransferase
VRFLGISAFNQDSAAALIVDGEIVVVVREERFTRKKHDPGFLAHTVRSCLAEGRLKLSELDDIAFHDRLLETYVAFAPRDLRSFRVALPLRIKEELFQKDGLATDLSQLCLDEFVLDSRRNRCRRQ